MILLYKGTGFHLFVRPLKWPTAMPPKRLNSCRPLVSYELGGPGLLLPAFVRGQAYLLARNGTAAAVEFRKLLDHPGIALNQPFGALAHLQLGRAHILTGDIASARADYQDFLTLWKDADPVIPILKEAKAEYAKLR